MAISTKPMLLLLFGLATLSVASTVPRDGPSGGSSGSGSDSGSGPGSSSGSGSGSGSGEAGSSGELAELLYLFKIAEIHGILATLAFAFVFPTGGILIRTLRGRHTVWLHAAWQVTGWLLALAAMGLGLWLARTIGYIELKHLQYHVAIGLVAVCGVSMQPVTGWVHHRIFKSTGGQRTGWSTVHVGWGIAVVTLGAINGGFGLVLAFAPRKYYFIYGVPAAAVWVTWMTVSVVSQARRGRSQPKKIEEQSLRGGGDANHDSPRRERRKERRLQEKARAVRGDSS